MKKIFMVCYGGGHVEIIKEIYNNLKSIKAFEITILALTTAKNKLDEVKIKYKLISDYYDEEIFKLGKEFCQQNNIETTIGEVDTFLYHGYALYDLKKRYTDEKIMQGFKKFGRRIFLPLSFFERIFKEKKPDLVITTNSPRYEKAALIVAKKEGIKTLSVEDLFGVQNELTKEMENFFQDNMYENIYGDNLCLLSKKSKKNIDSKKVKKIYITGNPAFDKVLKLYNSMNHNFKQIDKKNVKICFLSQTYPHTFLIINKLLEIVNKNRNMSLTIKIHPNEKIEEYRKKIQENLNITIKNNDLYKNILEADIIITINSTSGLEAILLDKVVLGEKNKFIPWKKEKIALEYEKIEEIEELIDLILEDENVIKNLKEERDKFRPKFLAGTKIKKIVKKILYRKF